MEGEQPPQEPVSRPATGDALELVAMLGRLALDPARGDVLGALAYWIALSRPPEPSHLYAIREAIAAGRATRREIIRQFVESSEFREYALIEGLLRDARAAGVPFDPRTPVAPGTTERAVEIPWVLSRCGSEKRILDVGYANALPVYLLALRDLPQFVHGVDLAAADLSWMVRTRADARALPYRADVFDLVLCVSSLEHVGYDNALYGTPQPAEPDGDARAVNEFERVIRPGGRVLVTVPYGRRERHPGFQQYDAAGWANLVARSRMVVEEQACYRLTADGWVREPDPSAMAEVAYGDVSARGVMCAVFRKPEQT